MSGSLIGGVSQLRGAIDQFEQVWERSEAGWEDVVRERFHEERVQPMLNCCQETMQAIQRLSDVLSAAQRACVDAEREAGGR